LITHRRPVDRLGSPHGAGTRVEALDAVTQTCEPFGAEPIHPTMRALTRDTELLGDMSDRTTTIDHPRDEQTTTMNSQTSINVGHEDLLGER